MTANSKLGLILDSFVSHKEKHSCLHKDYQSLKMQLAAVIRDQMGPEGPQEVDLPGIGLIKLPYFRMGNIDSVHLFDLDELILFYLYKDAASSYRRIIDIGGNIGLHSIVLAKLGFEVTCYEPDPVHFSKIVSNLKINDVSSFVTPVQSAISNFSGRAEFTRVLGNTTGSHLSGAKDNTYGDLEKFDVDIKSILDELKNTDLLKIDAEGEEYKILSSIPDDRWDSLDVVGEIGNSKNSSEVFDFLTCMNINIFSQKISWEKATSSDDLPSSYKEGSVFISRKEKMPWLS